MSFMAWPTAPIRFTVVTLVVVLTAIVVGTMVNRGKLYRNHIAHCQLQHSDPFCGIDTLTLDLPDTLRSDILHKLEQQPNTLAVRAYVPGVRAGRTMLTHALVDQLPAVIHWYESHARHVVSAKLGMPVQVTALSLPTTCCLLIYDEAGDGINWHYDVNYFSGRFFTVLVAVNRDPTCTSFVYRDAYGMDQSIDIHNQSVVFEGTKVYHKATPLCAGQKRVVLSLQYATDPTLTVWNRFMMYVKDRAFAGFTLG